MNNIEDAIKNLKKFCDYEDSVVLIDNALIEIQDAIEIVLDNLEALCDMQSTVDKKIKELDKTNNDLRLLYRRTANKLLENGKDELTRYFLAQINEVPTFTVDEDIDYYEEYYKLKEENLHWRGQYHLVTRKIGVISEQKIKDKIEEIEKEENLYAKNNIIKILQELLQESEK
mgnify:CR=1 FL=1